MQPITFPTPVEKGRHSKKWNKMRQVNDTQKNQTSKPQQYPPSFFNFNFFFLTVMKPNHGRF